MRLLRAWPRAVLMSGCVNMPDVVRRLRGELCSETEAETSTSFSPLCWSTPNSISPPLPSVLVVVRENLVSSFSMRSPLMLLVFDLAVSNPYVPAPPIVLNSLTMLWLSVRFVSAILLALRLARNFLRMRFECNFSSLILSKISKKFLNRIFVSWLFNM